MPPCCAPSVVSGEWPPVAKAATTQTAKASACQQASGNVECPGRRAQAWLPGRYCSASARCCRPMRSACSRSARVRATLSNRCAARRDSARRSQARSSGWSSAVSWQCSRRPTRSRGVGAALAGELQSPRLGHLCGEHGAALGGLWRCVEGGGLARHGQMQVDAVEQRSGSLLR